MTSDRRVPRAAAWAALLVLGAAWPLGAAADEIADVLGLKARNRDRVKRMSGEWTVETRQPAGLLKRPKSLRMRYRMTMEKLPPQARQHAHQPWRIESEILEPHPMRLRVEGEQAWYLNQRGQWIELRLTPDLREQFLGMSERFLGADPAEQRRHFAIRVVRRNNPIFGPSTCTIEFIPRGKAKLFARMEEDVNDAGLPLATRLYDDAGRETVRIAVTKHRTVNGIPVVDESEAVSLTPAGEVVSRTRCSGLVVETEP